jgi:hypothetical protein
MRHLNTIPRSFTHALLLAAVGVVALGCGASSGEDVRSREATGGGDEVDESDDAEMAKDAGAPSASAEQTEEEPEVASDDDEPEQADADDAASDETEAEEEAGGEDAPSQTDSDETEMTEVPGTDKDVPEEPAEEPATPDEDEAPMEADEPSASILWQYVQTEEEGAYLHNLLGDDELLPITGQVVPQLDVVPWSPDGKQLAQVVDGEVVFYTLGETATISTSYAAPQYNAVLGWIANYGVLLSGVDGTDPLLVAMKPDGSEAILGTDDSTAAPITVSIAPDGSEVVWTSSPVSTEAPTSFSTWHASFTNGEAGEPELLVEHTGSPMLDEKWSANANWMAYGISGPDDGGIYFWQKGTTSTIKVSPDGTSYTPLYDWSRDGSRFQMYVNGEAGSGLYTVGLGESGPTEAHLIASDEDASPAEWTGYGSLTYGYNGVGWLQLLDGNAAPTQAISFPDYSNGCNVVWLDESSFFHPGCQTSSALTYGQVDAGEITIEDVRPSAVGSVTLSPDGKCLLEWSEDSIQIGIADPAAYTPNTIGERNVAWFPSFTADSSALVYVALGVSLQYVELDGCAPVGEPLQRVAAGMVASTALVTR